MQGMEAQRTQENRTTITARPKRDRVNPILHLCCVQCAVSLTLSRLVVFTMESDVATNTTACVINTANNFYHDLQGKRTWRSRYSRIILFFLRNTPMDWKYMTFPYNSSCNSVGCFWNGGKVLGGSNVLNAMWYVRDENAIGMLKTFKEMGYKEANFNREQQEGIVQYTLHQGKRWINNTAFLKPVRYIRSNLKFVTNVRITKILINSSSKKAHGVEYKMNNELSSYYISITKKKVILSAGAIKSPQLLMLSVIGPKTVLDDFGIALILDLKVRFNSSATKVYGIANLKVVDASIMSVIPRGNINATTIMITKKEADMIKTKWQKS
uniref:(California timema) hypothetical protein n=1 Tax=Timema californicum TaxID=61474 RepID=A0A7R9J6K6_TIMCA|nr:unnamed protein product [Timema californicum]